MRFIDQYDFLSNFYPAVVTYDGCEFPTSENAYQYAKVNANLNAFQLCTPGQAKKMGRTLPISEGWESKKIDVMREILNSKFQITSELEHRLIDVKEEIIEHNHWHDNIWGICTCEKCGNKGENHLGRLLMEIRANRLIGNS